MYLGVLLSFITLTYCFFKLTLCHIMEGRIVGGDYTDIMKFPHAAFLHIQTNDVLFICGSTVLNQAMLVTAAHCFEILNKRSKVRVFAGHHDIHQAKVVRNAKRVYRHSKYNGQAIENDIALVKLKSGLPLGEAIKRVILLSSTPRSHQGILAGWGAVDAAMNEFTFKLKAVTQRIRSNTACSKIRIIVPGMICAGSLKRTESRPAKGDSGSGLITDDYEIIGLVSHMVKAFPALIFYTNVTYYYKWIHEKAQKISCPLNYS